MCVISTLEAKRLLHKGCEAYLTYVVDKSSLKVTLGSVAVVRKFSDVYLDELSGLQPNRELELEWNCCRDRLLFSYCRIG